MRADIRDESFRGGGMTGVRIGYRLRNDLYCVEWGVKLYSNQPTNPNRVMFGGGGQMPHSRRMRQREPVICICWCGGCGRVFLSHANWSSRCRSSWMQPHHRRRGERSIVIIRVHKHATTLRATKSAFLSVPCPREDTKYGRN